MKSKLPFRAALTLCLVLAAAAPAMAQLSIHYDVPGARIGVNLGGYPALQPIPGYPVYYAPGVNTNYFFYDGLYWVFDGRDWYASQWYNGPWGVVDPMSVPVYVLRVPVRYYRHAPAYFHGWRADAAPHWGEHWGRGWEERHRGWDHWDRGHVPARAPLPAYQREYHGDRYPDTRRQAEYHNERYRYQPRDEGVRQHYEQRRAEMQQQPREEHRGPGNSDRGHEQGRGQPQSQAPAQQGRQPEARTEGDKRPNWYSGG